jgi:aerobic carbon-monoxide dehydrogenase large subunit
MIDVGGFRAEQATAKAEGRILGLGLAAYVEPSTISFGVMSSEPALITMDVSGKVQVRLGTGSHGHSIETTIAQVVATHLGCDIDDVMIIQGDSDTSPLGGGTGGSRTAVAVGGAAQTASLELKDKLLQIAAHLLEANADDLEVDNGVVSVKGTPQAAIPFAQLAITAYMAPDLLPPGMEPGLEVTTRFRPPSQFTWSNAAHACTIELDPETGVVRFLRYVVSEDCGQMINPMVVEGQVAGGIAQGIGGVLFENLAYDDEGNPLATTFLDYLLPSAPEIPDFEYGHVESMSGSLGGYKGMGEGGAIVSPPAVANAINDALAQLGVPPLTHFPFDPNTILAAINAAR